MDRLAIFDFSLEETVLSAFSEAVSVQFHKQTDEEGVVIFIFEKVLHLKWYLELSNYVSWQTTFLKITEQDDRKVDLSLIDSVLDYHITLSGLPYNTLQLGHFKKYVAPANPILMVVGVWDHETNKPIVISPSNKKNLPVLITLAGYLELAE
ncbi:MAG: hypothetical protein IT257_08965 [Chitinophagaceae bacterium]|nr:hypothetical protein [Chitinophagaceae bacterium]